MDYSLPGSSVLGISQAKNTGVACPFLYQGVFSTQDQIRPSCIGRQSHQGNHYTSINNNKDINILDWYCSINLGIRREDDEEQSYSHIYIYAVYAALAGIRL